MKGISQNIVSNFSDPIFQKIEEVEDTVYISRKAKIKRMKDKVYRWFKLNI